MHTLLRQTLGWHEFRIGTRGNRANGCGVGSVGGSIFLALLGEGFDRLGFDTLYAISRTGQRAGPLIRGATCFPDEFASVWQAPNCPLASGEPSQCAIPDVGGAGR